MKVDIAKFLLFFDELMPATNEELGVYWFSSRRSDGISVIFSLSVYEDYVDIIIKNKEEVGISSLSLDDCTRISVLDENRKCLEVIHGKSRSRCFLSLLSDSILDYKSCP